MTKNIFAILFITLLGFSAAAQEMLTIPTYNPAVAKQERNNKKAVLSTESVKLPFYDDFSVLSVSPSPLRWADAFAFVNADYAKFPPSIGVATLDALDDKGALYTNAGAHAFDADYLTSLPIRLDSVFSPFQRAITRSDSVYLSFYYQPQGRTVSPPSDKASLILEFHSPGDNDTVTTATGTTYIPRWTEKWSTIGGIPVDTFALPDNHYFRQVRIPILDSSSYFKDGFQFRFHNIAALAGNSQPDWRSNGSHWNIDVVWLNIGLPVQKDVAFADKAPSMLVNYESMPFRQYRDNFVNETKDTLAVTIANLDNEGQNVTYKYDVRKKFHEPFATYNGGSFTLDPYLTSGYTQWKPFARPPVNFFFPVSDEEKIAFQIIHKLTPDPNVIFRSNDSIGFEQVFSNYYAYDNGSAEAGVGINGVAGSYAVQFKLNVSDTLRGIQMYFNPVISGSNQQPIDLYVWNDAFGKPGQKKDTLSGVTPSYTGLNEFITYWFETPLVIDPVNFPSLIFYIGWSQTFNDNLNVGFDRYKDSHTKRFYNVDGNWEMSSEINYGSLMMRPVIGPANPVGIGNPLSVQNLVIRPNPVTDGNLIIQLPESWDNNSGNDIAINIISATGSRALSGTFSNPVNVSALAPGFYMVLLTDKNSGRKASGKLIVR
jgi:hypothetical protein